MKRIIEKNRRRVKRKTRIRGRIKGTAERPRLTVFRSNRNLYAQVIDDVLGQTLASVSTVSGEFKTMAPRKEDAEKLGEALGKDLVAKNISEVVFDRNGYLYHGVVKALADGARKAGVKF
ncbi:large subunit ribosomal protein L18 [Alkalispirochaeta americana]|uniref:Large ribosomal subunit protein uL18 n=1 Tax=Alkalispirochaeta americana TaxID=159291 RepID=A0A1N6NI32_9SPIO|nr:50S ribosomal protein L18 [Alkalispirochaeta americana]SIP91703.1 large subunit ribosomal protein L18 [Alkalispirochaeta americana]